MPVYDKIALGKKARELGFVRDAFEKMSRLTGILQFINSDSELKPVFALKGGTAINLAVFDLPRLSVDIDMDFLDNLPKVEMAAVRERISDELGRFMANDGYVLKDKTKRSHALDSFVYSYTNAAGNPDNIKVEINYSLRSHVLPPVDCTARTSDVFEPFPIRTLAPVEIFASKIVALSARAAARDLYDVNNMVVHGLFSDADMTMMRKCAVFYMAVAGNISTRGFSFAHINDITPHKIKTDLYPMIRGAERFDLQAARDRVSVFLNERMALAENESAFLKRFSSGHYEPMLLFDDGEIAKRVKNHPMALWRLCHIREKQAER
jgi:predicted nucleotidyltransferase component of viral defense system